MLISFVIPIYNLPEWMLRECLLSIQKLSLPESSYEIVAVDDGSRQSPEATIREIFPLATVITKPNGGLSSARNAGIEAAKGDYIQFVDGDDGLLPQYNQIVATLQENQLDLLMFRLSRDKEVASASPSEPIHIATGAEYMAKNNLRASACGYIAKRDVIAEHRFPLKMLHEDELFTPLVVLNSQRMADINIAAYYYRNRNDSITQSRDDAHTMQRLDDTYKIISLLNDAYLHAEGTKQSALRRRTAQLSMDYLYNTMRLMPRLFASSAAKLREIGLFPLPKGDYTIKYSLFRIIIRMLRPPLTPPNGGE